jgi:hypothetical protein
MVGVSEFEEIRQEIISDTVRRMKSLIEEEGTCDETRYHAEECVRWFIEDLQQWLVQHLDGIILEVDDAMKKAVKQE